MGEVLISVASLTRCAMPKEACGWARIPDHFLGTDGDHRSQSLWRTGLDVPS